MSIPNIDTNWKKSGSLAQQLAGYGYTNDRAKEISQDYASSSYPTGDWADYAKDNNIIAYDTKPLPTDGLFINHPYGTQYLGDNGQVMTSQFGPDKPMTMSEFNKFGETHPIAAAQAGAAGLKFDVNGNAINTTAKDNLFGMSTGKWNNALKMGQLGLGAGQLGLGIMSYLDNKKTANIQRNLLNQQYNNNAELIADRKANKAALSKLHIS